MLSGRSPLATQSWPVSAATSSPAVRSGRAGRRRAPWCRAAAPGWGRAAATAGPACRRSPSPRRRRPPSRRTGAGSAAEVGPGVVGGLVDGAAHGSSSVSRSMRPRAASRLYRPFSGRTSAYCRSTELQPGGVPVEAVAVPVGLEQRELGHPVQLPGQLHRVVSSRSSTDSQRLSTSAVSSSTSPPYRSSTYLRASSRYSRCSCTAVIFRPSRSVTRCTQVGSCETARSSDDGRVERQVPARKLVLDHREHQRGGADLEVGGHLATGWRRR